MFLVKFLVSSDLGANASHMSFTEKSRAISFAVVCSNGCNARWHVALVAPLAPVAFLQLNM